MTAPDVGTWDQPRAGGLPWGTSTEADWSRWASEHREGLDDGQRHRALDDARRLWQVADAYAHGWVKAAQLHGGDRMSVARAAALERAAYAFGHEYERVAWLYAVGRGGMREGYGRAWELYLRATGLDQPERHGLFVLGNGVIVD